MTLHNAKGLEFPVVFIIGMEDGRVPAHALDRGGRPRGGAAARYVGITRAKRELYLTYARTRALFGGRDWNLPSRFLDEIPAELTDRRWSSAFGRPRRAVHRWSDDAAGDRGRRSRRRAPSFAHRRRRGARALRRRRGDRASSPAAWWWSLRRRRLREEADGRLRTPEEEMSARSSTARRSPRSVRERVARDVEALARDGRASRAWRRSSWATTPRRTSTCATSARRRAEVGHRSRSTTSSPASVPQDELADLITRAERRRRGQRHPAAAAGARPHRRRRDDRADRPAEGRRRPHAAQRRAAAAGPRGPRAVHARRGHGAAALRRRRADRGGGGGARPLEARRASRWRRCCWPRNATVTQCHSRTRDLAAVCRRADVLVAAVGVPRLVTADMVSEGAIVIDVGINRTDDGLVGDVDFDAVKEKAAGDHAGARRRRPDDDRDAALEHGQGGPRYS